MAIELKKEGDEVFVILPLKDFKEITDVYVDFMDFKVEWEKEYNIKDFGDPKYKAYPINEPLLKEIKAVLELFNEQGTT